MVGGRWPVPHRGDRGGRPDLHEREAYAGEHAGPDVALSTLVRALEAVRSIKRHGIASGPWDQREDWLTLFPFLRTRRPDTYSGLA